MIIILDKTFADTPGKRGGGRGSGKNNSDDDTMKGFLGRLIKDYMRNEEKKKHGRPGRLQRKLNRLNGRCEEKDIEIDIQKKTDELKNKKKQLDNLRQQASQSQSGQSNAQKKDFIDRVKTKAKEIIDNPKVRKGAKIAGITTLAAAAGTGIVAGGIKLKKKIDEKKANKKVKESITGEEPENNEQQ